jgi:hypothetical protein
VLVYPESIGKEIEELQRSRALDCSMVVTAGFDERRRNLGSTEASRIG